ncbi:G-type lectin S-receptor-like serine/threonine-protein kinase B120 [Actinidia eriantha]|uniref:G-type lectin S-receptor-like serine/threonine-protein kinase B120 n=1 Tax=Actinidia eriantha TaxID=165200 RepID=UPI00258D7592|nr:G-type lectin S-receptor-like serine/threonine-protein kinase B120 [Actinidia eriantha]
MSRLSSESQKLNPNEVAAEDVSQEAKIGSCYNLVSQGNIFELGFFQPGNSLNISLGIRYKNFVEQMTVWVANREKPLSDPSSATLEFSDDGDLVVIDHLSKTLVWTTNLGSPTSNSTQAVLLDDRNFVLTNSLEPSVMYWQSFDPPTDTWLPGAKLGINKITGKTQRFVSWKNSKDPAPGLFSLEIDPSGSPQFFLGWNLSKRYWSSGLWDGEKFSLVPEMRYHIYNFSFVSNERESFITYSVYNSSILSRFNILPSGQIKQLTWLVDGWDWFQYWAQPRKQSDVYAFCGEFGIFDETSSTRCACFSGFKLLSQLGDWSGGCVRKTPLQCESNNSNGKYDGFLKFSNLKLPASSKVFPASDRALLNFQLPDGNSTKQSLYLQLEASELIDAGGVKYSIEDLLSFDFDGGSADATSHEENAGHNLTRGEKNVNLPFFSFSSVSATTGGFSSANKLGEGGFGPVYRGKLPRGQEIAVKRLSKRSGQGLEELKNERVLIAKLQHRNLVSLLGCCIEQDEKILIYEYMPNKSLDFFLFDWEARMIAQGLLYLHQYSRLRVIHRDLKASNILLDGEMNPKISDFGMACIFGGNESQANTKRIVGT